jgi:hypothetical protein
MCKTQGHGRGYMNRGEVCYCGCGGGRFKRCFFTEAERLSRLEDYKRNLEDELAALAEEIEKAKKMQ